MTSDTEAERITHVDQSQNDGADNTIRKPYVPPRLELYGDVRAITNMIGNMGNLDGGVSPTHKTST